MFYRGKAARLNAPDIAEIAASLSVEEAAFRAVIKIEANGRPFDSQGRVTALYEKHIAYRESSGIVRSRLTAAGLAAPSWTSDYRTPAYVRIDKAIPIAGEEIVARSTSWGMGQIMGFNHKAAGYSDAVSMVKVFADSERAQVEGMANFIRAHPAMLTALRNRNWTEFARRYNGSGYAKNEYHTKLAEAYRDFSRNMSNTPAPSSIVLRRGSNGAAVTRWQETLNALNFKVDIVGNFGPMTENATRDFQRSVGLTPDGVAGPKTLEAANAKKQNSQEGGHRENLLPSLEDTIKPPTIELSADDRLASLEEPAPTLSREDLYRIIESATSALRQLDKE